MSEATPHLRNILDLLEIRGCRTEFQPQALGPGRGAWIIFYEATPPDKGIRSRMVYPDTRGELQAMELLKDLNARWAPNTLVTPKAFATEALEILKEALTYDT